MKTLQQIETALTAWAQANEDIRAAFVVGSTARPDHPADEWSDLDMVLFTRCVERYYMTSDWIEALAPVWLTIQGRTAAGDLERQVLFAGGLQVDFVLHPSDLLAQVPQMLAAGQLPDTVQRGTRVLLDKDGALAHMPPPARPPAQQPPDERMFRTALDEFWFAGVYCAKQLRRGELWTFQNGSSVMSWRLLQMVEWHARAVRGWDHDTWHRGKFIAEWAAAGVYDDLCRTSAHLDVQDSWRALRARLDLYRRLAREVAARLGLDYPADLETQIHAYIDRLQHT